MGTDCREAARGDARIQKQATLEEPTAFDLQEGEMQGDASLGRKFAGSTPLVIPHAIQNGQSLVNNQAPSAYGSQA
jgi:hypothetical protein